MLTIVPSFGAAIDFGAAGFTVERRTFPFSGGADVDVVELPEAEGGFVRGATIPSGLLTIEGSFGGATHAAAWTLRDQMVAACSRGRAVTVRFSDITDRVWVPAYATRRTMVNFQRPELVARRGPFLLEFVCPQPARRENNLAANLTAGVTSGSLTAGVGARSGLTVDVTNGGTAVITAVSVTVLRESNTYSFTRWDGSSAAGTLLPPPVPAGETLRIDAQTGRVHFIGTNQNVAHGITRGHPLPFLDPLEGAVRLLVAVVGGPAASITARWFPRFL